jgi:hypothetical protein
MLQPTVHQRILPAFGSPAKFLIKVIEASKRIGVSQATPYETAEVGILMA